MNIKNLQKQKRERVKHFYDDKQASFIFGLDTTWKRYTEKCWTEGKNKAFSDLFSYEPLQYLLEKKVNQWANAWYKKRITKEDFTSVFYEEVWKTVSNYSWHDEFYLYEQIDKALDMKAIDLIRSCSTDKRKANHFDLYLKNNWWNLVDPYQTDDILTKISIQQVCKDDTVLILTLLDSPDLSLRDLAGMFGKSHQTIKRRLDKAKTKISRYII